METSGRLLPFYWIGLHCHLPRVESRQMSPEMRNTKQINTVYRQIPNELRQADENGFRTHPSDICSAISKAHLALDSSESHVSSSLKLTASCGFENSVRIPALRVAPCSTNPPPFPANMLQNQHKLWSQFSIPCLFFFPGSNVAGDHALMTNNFSSAFIKTLPSGSVRLVLRFCNDG